MYDFNETNPDLASLATAQTPILQRGAKRPNPRRMVFADGRSMQPLPDALARYAELPSEKRPDIVMWCGNEPRHRMIRADVEAAERSGWQVTGYRSDLRSATFAKLGYRVEVRSSAVWFGNASDPELIHDAWYDLSRTLRSGFGPDAYLWPTPTLTGQELLRGKLPFNRAYPTIPAETLEILLNVVGGGRSEVLTAPGALNGGLPWLPEIFNLDMRWAYASCLHGLPVGPLVHDKAVRPVDLTAADVGYEASFYKFHARIPAGWQHIGLLPMREPGQQGHVYPHKPGASFYGWATGAEIQVAVNHGWRVSASQKISWPSTGRHDVMGGQHGWIGALRALRANAQRRSIANPRDAVAPLVAAAIRNIVVHTVGGFNRVTRIDEGFAPYGSEASMPEGAIPLPADGGWAWKRNLLRLDEWSHPEWYGTVVGRVRAKVARKALTLPSASIVSIRTDGIMTTAQPDVSADTGQPGDWRIKWHFPFHMPAPLNNADVLIILDAVARDGMGGDADTDHLEAE